MRYLTLEEYNEIMCVEETDEENFPKLCCLAEDIVDLLTKNYLILRFENCRDYVASMVKKAVAAQINFFEINGITINDEDGYSASIGKFTYSFKDLGSNGISKMTIAFLNQAGLLNRGVGVAD